MVQRGQSQSKGRVMGARKKCTVVPQSNRHPFTALYHTLAGRRLTTSELAFIALDIMERDFKAEAARRKKAGKKVVSGEKGSAVAIASNQFGVSASYIQYAARIRRADRGLEEKIRKGKET